MSTKDLYSIGDVYGNMLRGVKVVTEKAGPGDKELNDKGAAGLQKGGPPIKGGAKKKGKMMKKKKKGENKFDASKFSDEDDKAVVKESVQVLSESFSRGKNRSDGLVAQIVSMGRSHIGTLRNIIHEMNATNKQATVNLLATLSENKHLPLYAECKATLKKVVQYDKQRQQYLLEKSRKVSGMNLNTGMKRTSFDTLYEAVMGDGVDELDELGVDSPSGEFDALGDELGGDVEDSVTVTLDRATAQTLIDLLTAAVGGGEEDLTGDDLGGMDDMGGEDISGDGAFGDEDEETMGHALHGAKKPNDGKNNKVGNLKPAGGKASKDVTDKIGDDGDYGHALHGAKQPDMGKQNKVGNLKPGNGLFS